MCEWLNMQQQKTASNGSHHLEIKLGVVSTTVWMGFGSSLNL